MTKLRTLGQLRNRSVANINEDKQVLNQKFSVITAVFCFATVCRR